jgi:hypothetical protein
MTNLIAILIITQNLCRPDIAIGVGTTNGVTCRSYVPPVYERVELLISNNLGVEELAFGQFDYEGKRVKVLLGNKERWRAMSKKAENLCQ